MLMTTLTSPTMICTTMKATTHAYGVRSHPHMTMRLMKVCRTQIGGVPDDQ